MERVFHPRSLCWLGSMRMMAHRWAAFSEEYRIMIFTFKGRTATRELPRTGPS
jgi:hypothetical protein